MTLDTQKMLSDICGLVETDFCMEMDIKRLPGSKRFTQKEAKQMANIIGQVYMIAHGIHCVCGGKYEVSDKIGQLEAK